MQVHLVAQATLRYFAAAGGIRRPRWAGPAAVAALVVASGLARAEPPAAEPRPGELCLPAITSAEAAAGVPQHLLRSIALVESGRADPAPGRAVPWPWTINAAGVGSYFDTKAEAVAAVRRLLAGGVRSIDIGCAQVNLQHHPGAFASLETAFDPAENAAYAARFLTSLRATTGSWPLAAAGYHSLTPERGHAYARRVMVAWPGAARDGAQPRPAAAVGARAAPDAGIYTAAFAARVRRMDEDRSQYLAPAATRGAGRRDARRTTTPVTAWRDERRAPG